MRVRHEKLTAYFHFYVKYFTCHNRLTNILCIIHIECLLNTMYNYFNLKFIT